MSLYRVDVYKGRRRIGALKQGRIVPVSAARIYASPSAARTAMLGWIQKYAGIQIWSIAPLHFANAARVVRDSGTYEIRIKPANAR